MHPIVTPAWLAEHLSDRDLAVFDATLPPVGAVPPADTHARYLAGHIPGAIFFNIEELSDHSTSLPHMLPTPERFSLSMASLGVSDAMSIVVYEQEGMFSAPRAWWMLRTFGVQHVSVLDGGLRAWVEAGLPVQAGPVDRAPAAFHARLNSAAVKDFSAIQQMITEHAQILDARSAGRFTGASPEPRPGLSSGHMPGAVSTPYTDLLEAGRLKPAAKLREYFFSKEVNLEEPITTTCGSGVTAAVVALGLQLAGAKYISLYDGSWSEYAQHPEAVIEKGE
ncbi:3-mercaptopyruvate sulfurtransferase [Paracidobacterium acidisoli]|uniref:3-mercaptopyruvate sulfurtransferase n=1 Tax=Paracidobacterium acidisoli TaxID=2303751 RepID=A0A372IUQ2_9BACT|nr:3-mercaptopyruvate sulfurtransferase [Paracidobacterium acidisoli]MBT9330122.1 3-mercaptopyruvate sulfurtransferase [Paracidobacterium acidisoli]